MRRARTVNPNQPVVGPAEVAALLGWDARRVAVYAGRGVLPRPLAWLAMGPVWHREDIVRWAAERGLAAVSETRQAPRRGVEAAAAPAQGRGTGPADGAPPSQPVRFESRYQWLVLFGAPGVGAVRFSNGRFETSETAVIEWLRRHPSHGIDFHEAGRA